MSWHIKLVGSPRAVAAAVVANPSLPSQLKELASSLLAGIGEKGAKAVHFDCSGHLDAAYGGSLNNFSVGAVDLLLDPVEPVAVAPAPAAAAPAAEAAPAAPSSEEAKPAAVDTSAPAAP